MSLFVRERVHLCMRIAAGDDCICAWLTSCLLHHTLIPEHVLGDSLPSSPSPHAYLMEHAPRDKLLSVDDSHHGVCTSGYTSPS